jgi:hypothetical protein
MRYRDIQENFSTLLGQSDRMMCMYSSGAMDLKVMPLTAITEDGPVYLGL